MGLDIFKEKGVSLDKQQFTWRDLVQSPTSKLDDDAFTRVRIILMNGLESEALRFSHACARMNRGLQLALARVRRVEQHQQTMVNWLLPADLSPLETTLAFEQVAIEVTASVAEREPDALWHRSTLRPARTSTTSTDSLPLRRVAAATPKHIQNYSDIMPGRPTVVEHRDPTDDLREHYDRNTAEPLTKLHAVTIMAAENQTHDYYMTIGPMFADPVARQLYAEIASIEEQHTTQYESIIDADETWMEKWLMHEAMEVYNYMGCSQYESNPRVKAIWDRFLDYELGQLHFVMELFKQVENRDPAEILPASLPEPIEYRSHREFVRETTANDVGPARSGTQFVVRGRSPSAHSHTAADNSEGSLPRPWPPGTGGCRETELTAERRSRGKGLER